MIKVFTLLSRKLKQSSLFSSEKSLVTPAFFGVIVLGFAWSYEGSWAVEFSRLKESMLNRYGSDSLQVYNSWESMMNAAKNARSEDKLKRVNEFFNRRMQWGPDQKVWGAEDYWATPLESLAKGAGDCEDFAIAKYFSLLAAGVPVSKLRMIYVKAQNLPGDANGEQAHMILAYYQEPDAEPLILDNLITDIRPASRRPDLQPVFSFNSEGVFLKDGSSTSGNVKNSRWLDLMKRAKDEGFGS